MRKTTWAVALCAAVMTGTVAGAQEPTAQEIARKARDRGALNLRDLTAELKLTTVRNGNAKEQVLRTTGKEIGGRAHSLARFLEPAGVAGVTVLTVEGQGDAADAISIFLPKLKRVRKVAQTQRGEAFMGTDFNYADLGGTGTEEQNVKRLGDAKVEGRDVYVLESRGDDSSPYGKVTLFVDKETSVPLRIDYDDKAGKALKQYKTLKLKKFKDRVLAAESQMQNVQTGSTTKMEIRKIDEQTLGDEAFTERALERG